MTSSLAFDERRRAEGINDVPVRQKRKLKLSVLMRVGVISLFRLNSAFSDLVGVGWGEGGGEL